MKKLIFLPLLLVVLFSCQPEPVLLKPCEENLEGTVKLVNENGFSLEIELDGVWMGSLQNSSDKNFYGIKSGNRTVRAYNTGASFDRTKTFTAVECETVIVKLN